MLAMSILHPMPDDGTTRKFRPKPDGNSDPAGEAGWFLQRERERRNLSLPQVAEILDIHETYLEAIEQGDITRMPSRSEILGLVSLYGQFLGFDPKPLVHHFADILPGGTRAARLMQVRTAVRPPASAKIIQFSQAAKILSSRRAQLAAGTVLGIALLFGVAHAWIDAAAEPEPIVQASSEPPPQDPGIANSTTSPETSPQAAVSETPLQDDVATGESHDPQSTDDLTAFISKQLAADANPNVKSARMPSVGSTGSLEPPSPAAPEKAATNSRVVLKARAPVWFRVEDTRGNVIASKIMALGDTYEVPNRDDLVIISRDGGLIGYSVDGIDRGALGTPGEILVGRSLSIARLLDSNG